MNIFFNRIKGIKKTNENINFLISIVIDIAYRNPRVYPISIAILSKLFLFIEENYIKEIINLIIKKFDKIPNTGHLQVWLQRAILKYERERYFEEKLCQKLNDPKILIWNSEWLNNEMKNLIDCYPLVDEEILNNMDTTLSLEEVQLFGLKSNYVD
jgi:RNA-directed DNA polymerase